MNINSFLDTRTTQWPCFHTRKRGYTKLPPCIMTWSSYIYTSLTHVSLKVARYEKDMWGIWLVSWSAAAYIQDIQVYHSLLAWCSKVAFQMHHNSVLRARAVDDKVLLPTHMEMETVLSTLLPFSGKSGCYLFYYDSKLGTKAKKNKGESALILEQITVTEVDWIIM